MKILNKAFHILLALALMLILTVPAFAVSDYIITVSNTPSTTGVWINNQTYSSYRIFNVTYNTEGTAYSYTVGSDCLNVSYDPDGSGNTYGSLSGSDVINWLSSSASTDDVRSFADYVYTTYINKTPAPNAAGTATATSETAAIDVGTPGYYLVYGTGSNGNATVTASVSLTTTDPTAVVEPKLSAPTLTKQIQHNEKENAADNGWGNVADNQIGDTVNYRTITTVPDTNNYDTYTYVIHDTMDDGLTFNNNVSIAVSSDTDPSNNNALSTNYYTVDASPTDGHTFDVTVNILAAISAGALNSGDTLTTSYTATLNRNAKVYSDGYNENTAYLTYSNNPYDEETGESPHVTVYDWTFTMGVNKVDGQGNSLTGAEFILNKDSSSTSEPIVLIYNDVDQSYTVAPAGSEGTTNIISAGSIIIKGLDDATTYYLHETQAPAGYNVLPGPVSFTISADYETAGNTLGSGSPSVVVGTNPSSATLSTNVENLTGNELPTTGGMGTRMLYAIGGTLTTGAGIVLVTRKRVKNEK